MDAHRLLRLGQRAPGADDMRTTQGEYTHRFVTDARIAAGDEDVLAREIKALGDLDKRGQSYQAENLGYFRMRLVNLPRRLSITSAIFLTFASSSFCNSSPSATGPTNCACLSISISAR